MQTGDLNVALVQFSACLGEPQKNLENCIKYAIKAADEGADVICFPELCSTGYTCNPTLVERMAVQQDLADFIIPLSETAQKYKIVIIYSYIEKTKQGYHISAAVFDKDGSYRGSYRKCYHWADEKAVYTGDEEFPVFQTAIGKIGILICYDIEYPEPARRLWEKGAEIIFAPMHFWNIAYLNKYVQAMAFYYTLPVVAVNGLDGKKDGCSQVVDHLGNTILQFSEKEEGMKIVTVSLDDETSQREVHKMDYKIL